jgi:hypothetical protein
VYRHPHASSATSEFTKLLRDEPAAAAGPTLVVRPPPARPVGSIPGLDPADVSRAAQKNKARREKKKAGK